MDLIINVNKPKGISSQGATTQVKKILKAKKAGHTGTLDPTATGVLLICINKATRLTSYISALDKEYKTVMKLGEVTDTQDTEGSVIEKTDRIKVNRTQIENALKSFEGETLQRPPMFSAIKYKGTPLYKYARKGIDIPRESRKVYIRNIELLNIEFPFVSFKTICSKGTYIRTLCNDIGKKLGTGAHLFELERTAIGRFNINDSLSFEALADIVNEGGACTVGKKASSELSSGVYTMGNALSWMPDLKIKESLVKAVKNGSSINASLFTDFPDDLKTAVGIKIKSPDGKFLAVGRFSARKNAVKMDVVFET